MWHRILAILRARNREFYRDRAGLGWNILMPFVMVFGFAFIFSGEPEALFKIGVLSDQEDLSAETEPFLGTEHLKFVPMSDPDAAVAKVERHQIDLLLDLRGAPVYWINLHAPKGYLAERLLISTHSEGTDLPRRETVSGEALRYVDWVLPGVLGMNIMFSSLWGVGWVIVRYRKNGVLRRLQATPLSAFEFLTAQVFSRLTVVLGASLIVYVGANLLLDFVMRGSYLVLFLVYLAGSLSFISLGLVVASRLRTEEVADGILNLLSWPMLLLSGVWFSMDGTNPAAQLLSQILPLTHLVDAARAVMIDGAGILEILPEILLLAGSSLVLLGIAARLFRWD